MYINGIEYELKELNTGIYLDLLYIVYNLQNGDTALYTDNQIDLVVDSTGIERDKLLEIHPAEFTILANDIMEHYSENAFFKEFDNNGNDKKGPKILKIKK